MKLAASTVMRAMNMDDPLLRDHTLIDFILVNDNEAATTRLLELNAVHRQVFRMTDPHEAWDRSYFWDESRDVVGIGIPHSKSKFGKVSEQVGAVVMDADAV